MILAGDIGGTHTRLALFERKPTGFQPLALEVFASAAYSGLAPVLRDYLKRHEIVPESACFGIAGPVRNQRCEASNLPWIVDSQLLMEDLGIKLISLTNDLEANAYGVALLQPSDFVVLNAGVPVPAGNQALISAGTGLGEAGLIVDDRDLRPFPSEGGHVDFGPRNELEMELLRSLLHRFGHVSYERVLSGPGLCNIYEFLRKRASSVEPIWLTSELAQGEIAATISRNGMKQTCPVCMQALDMFVSIYGSEAGNLALKVMATGGLYVGGGIAPGILSKLQGPEFMRSFVSKGRMSKLLHDIPVKVIKNDMTALLGAAYVASRTLAEKA